MAKERKNVAIGIFSAIDSPFFEIRKKVKKN